MVSNEGAQAPGILCAVNAYWERLGFGRSWEGGGGRRAGVNSGDVFGCLQYVRHLAFRFEGRREGQFLHVLVSSLTQQIPTIVVCTYKYFGLAP